jgi:Mg-chelatase subunit ChlD
MKPIRIQSKLRKQMTRFQIQRNSVSRKGAMLPLIAVTLVLLFVACLIGVDIARVHVTRSELRTATDAAARAGVEALGREQNRQAAIDAALAVAQLNLVAGDGLLLDEANILFGESVEQADGSFQFTESGGTDINAIRVVGERTGDSPQGAVTTFFGGMFGRDDFEPIQSATATRLDRDIALVLDVSGSMRSFGRFEALQNALNVFLSQLNESQPEEFVSLIVYESKARQLVSLTENMADISGAFADENPGGATGIGRGLILGLKSLQQDAKRRTFARRSIIVMTDGNQNTGVNPKVVAKRDLQKRGITVHSITFGTGADQTLMKEVAETTGGIHLHAESDAELVEAFKTIANTTQVLLTQ